MRKITLLFVLLMICFCAHTWAKNCPETDLTNDCLVDLDDLVVVADQWLGLPGSSSDFLRIEHDDIGVDIADLGVIAASWLVRGAELSISEFVASNSNSLSTVVDGITVNEDWIEIYNSTNHRVYLAGWTLTDNEPDHFKWQFPDGPFLDPDSYMVVFASNKNQVDNPDNYPYLDDSGYYHTNFSLDPDGEYLALYAPGGLAAQELAPKYPTQISDVSYGLTSVGSFVQLVATGDAATYLVPANDTDQDLWTEAAFDDSAWNTGITSFRFNVAADTGGLDLLTSDNDMDLSGNIAYAVNVGDRGGYSPFQIGDVTFFGDIDNNGPYPPAADVFIDGYSINYDGAWVLWMPPSAKFSGNMNNMLRQWGYKDASNPNDKLQVQMDVTPGQKYKLQLIWGYTWEMDFLYGDHYIFDVYVEGQKVLENFCPQNDIASLGGTWQDNAILWSGFVTDDGDGRIDVELTNAGVTNNNQDWFPFLSGLILSQNTDDTGTNVESEMLGQNSSIWTRIEFDVEDPSHFNSLMLKMKYEDGFVTYLNGKKAAEQNAPVTPIWNSSATADRPVNHMTEAFAEYDISDLIPYLRQGSNVLAVHGLNDTLSDDEFMILPELIASGGKEGYQYIVSSTPGQPNVSVTYGKVADTNFSADRGFYERIPLNPLLVEISCDTEDAIIHYTTDGTWPSETHGTVYVDPVLIETTTVLRAITFKPGYLSSNIDTQTYIFLDDVIDQPSDPAGFPASWTTAESNYEMDPDVVYNSEYYPIIKDALLDIPTMSIVMDLDDIFHPSTDSSIGGIYSNCERRESEWTRPASLEVIYPDGSKGYQINCGIRVYGGVGRTPNFYKHSFRPVFRSIYGPKKMNYDLFGEDAAGKFDTFIMRASFNNSVVEGNNRAQLIRDQWCRVTMGDMGQPTLHGTFVHLYINGLYWGLYNPTERCTADYGEQYFGGDKEEYDSINRGEIRDGTIDAWNTAFSIANAGVADADGYSALAAFVDIENLIDYMIMNFYGGNDDWDGHNWYSLRRSGRAGSTEGRWQFFSWDAERTLEDVNRDKSSLNNNRMPSRLHQKLSKNPEYRLQFADRLHRHMFNGGALTTGKAAQRYQNLADEIELAIIGESARWGDTRGAWTRNGQWIPARDWILNTFFVSRPAVFLTQMKARNLYPNIDAPVFYVAGSYQHGGYVAANAQFTMTASSGTIYYTLDGSDPRNIAFVSSNPGGVSATAIQYTGEIDLNKSCVVNARAYSGGQWSALTEATFAQISVIKSLRVSEIMYHSTDATAAELLIDSTFSDEDFEYIELENIGTEAINLNLVHFTDGIDFTFGDYSLAAGEYTVLVANQTAFQARYPGVSTSLIAGTYTGSLDNSGEEIVLRDAIGEEIHDFDYDDNWYDITDGDGFSLTIRDAYVTDLALWDQKAGWQPSAAVAGSPGADDAGLIPKLGAIVINEILAHSDGYPNDWVELYNTTGSPINISGWFLSDSDIDKYKYEIAANTWIESGGYLVFTRDDHFGGDFALSENGETFHLCSPVGTGYVEEETFGASERNVAFGRHYKASTDSYNFVAMSSNTPGVSYQGAPNACPKVGPIVINEIMYHPTDIEGDAEYIELLNVSGSPVTLYDYTTSEPWKITLDNDEYYFPSATPATIVAGGYFLLIKDITAFTIKHGVPLCDFAVWTDGSLSNGGEKVEISMPGDVNASLERQYIRVDRVNYSDGSHPLVDDLWPTDPDGTGTSLFRVVSANYGNDVINWQSAIATPGVLNPLPDTDPPSPTQAIWASSPAALSDTAISMTATTGSDMNNPVEYFFDEISGNPGATDSAWQTLTTYIDTGLDPETQYTYTVTMRDKLLNTGTASIPGNATTNPPHAVGTGLKGEYYDNIDFTGSLLTRTDPAIGFEWSNGSPDPSMGSDDFSVRWTGEVVTLHSETYTFKTSSDDGVRLWVNGRLIIDNWTDHGPTDDTGIIALSAGVKYDIKLEYYENGGGALIRLYWLSPSQAEQIIPQASLYPPQLVEIINEDFESGWGIWTDGGDDCAGSTSYPNSGTYSIELRDDSASASSMYIDDADKIDVSGKTTLYVGFSYMPDDLESGEHFLLEIFQGGVWVQLDQWIAGADFPANTIGPRQNPSNSYVIAGISNLQLRFRCNASSDTDNIYIDDIVVCLD